MSGGGRKRDNIWEEFKELPKMANRTGYRVKCKHCDIELQGLVDRMKKHFSSCSNQKKINVNASRESTLPELELDPTKHNNLEKYVVKTSAREKEIFDEQIARFFYSCNLAFHKTEHAEFVKVCHILHPGYKPPGERQLSNELLDKVFAKEHEKCCNALRDEFVCLALDGWSNVNNCPIICACVIDEKGKVTLIETVDTSGHKHDAQYLKILTSTIIRQTEAKYGCKIRSIVTDNAANMTKMRDEIEDEDDINVISYGCSAHILNLLARDFGKEFEKTQHHTIRVSKYFRNHQLPNSWYIAAGGSALVLPSEVRWNTICDTVKAYLKNWPILMQVCDAHQDEIDATIIGLVQNLVAKRKCEELIKVFQPISNALDKIQSNHCKIADCVIIWKKLEKTILQNLNSTQKKCFCNRYKMALKPYHFASFLVSPTSLFGQEEEESVQLTQEEKHIALKFIELTFSESFLALSLKLQAKIEPFSGAVMNKAVIQSMNDFNWWKSFMALNPMLLNAVDIEKLNQLKTAVASSAGIERVFSTFGQVQTKLRNRLGVEKAAKLTFLYKQPYVYVIYFLLNYFLINMNIFISFCSLFSVIVD